MGLNRRRFLVGAAAAYHLALKVFPVSGRIACADTTL
jgi:hypothetical protein